MTQGGPFGRAPLTYQYNANDWLTNRNSLAKGPTLYGYDNVGNLLSVSYQHSPALAFSYDALNRVTNMVDGIGTTAYAYDGAGQLLSEAGPWSGVSVSNTYSSRLRQSMSVQAPGAAAWTNGYYYDSARRLINVTSPAGSFGYQFAPGVQGVPSGITLPNGASIADAYDSVARLLSTTLKNSQLASLALHQYGYNLAGQRTNQTRLHGDYVTYTYDGAGRLNMALGREAGGAGRAQEQLYYTYDPAGNLGYRTNNGLVEAFSVNAGDELTASVPRGTLTVAGGATPGATSVTVACGAGGGQAARYADGTWALSGLSLPYASDTYVATAQWAGGQQATSSVSVYLPPSAGYAYDGNGNLLSDGNRGFAYDDENRLVSVWVTNVWRSDFSYDGKMRLRQRVEYAWSGSGWNASSTVRYVYDGSVVVQEQDQNNAPMVSYTRGSDLSGSIQGAGGIGGLLARTDNSLGTSAYYFADGNGNVTCMLDGNQAVAASYLYDPYGRILSQSGWLANANLHRFSSKEFQINSGLVYYLYRFYDPNLQRWVNRDPLGEVGGINLCAYARNDPANQIDPYGLNSIAVTVAEAIASGNVAQMEALLELGDSIGLTPALQAALRAAIAAAAAGAAASGGDRCHSRGRSDPVAVAPVNPGRNKRGKSNPCPPPPPPWPVAGDAHGSTGGTHWHWIVYNQDPSTCQCFPKRMSGQTPPMPPPVPPAPGPKPK